MAKKPTTQTNDPLRAFYDRRHPAYEDLQNHWTFLRASYNGGRAWFASNVFRYHKEGKNEFDARLQRAYRFNHTREVVDLVQKYLFKGAIVRNEENAPKEVVNFWKKATLSGIDVGQLIRTGSTGNSIDGRVAIVVDNNLVLPADNTANKISVKAVAASNARVYAYVVNAIDILDYAWDEDGDGGLLWIKLRERTREDADHMRDDGAIIERIRVWTRNTWELYQVKVDENIGISGARRSKPEERVEKIDEGVHNLGIVPVVLFDHSIGDYSYSVPGLIDDIAYLDRAVTNYLSNLDAIIQDQTFSQLAIPAQAIQQGDDMYNKVLELGTSRIFVYDSGSGSSAKPEYLSPDPKQAGVILTVIEKIINEIYHTVGLAGERTKQDNAVGIDNSSGVAKAYDFERVNSLLLSKAAACQLAENKIVDLVCRWNGIATPEEDVVKYPLTFDVMRLADDLVIAEALAKMVAPIEMRREQMILVIDKMFPRLKKEVLEKIKKDVSTWLEGSDVILAPPTKFPGAKPAAPVSAPKQQGQVTANTK